MTSSSPFDLTSPNTVIILAGATSVGKSAVSMELSKRFPSEIIIADSVQIYKGLDIGANKPTLEEQRLIPHHLVDVAEPNEAWNTADFCYRAVQAIDDILARGKTPIVVGGSTMWIQWLVHGIPDAPKASEEAGRKASQLMDHLERRGDEEAWFEALDVLRQHDPIRATKLFKNDWYRLRRYLEVALDLPSSVEESKRATLNGERTLLLPRDRYDLRCFFLVEEREELYSIIDERCEQMVQNGLFEETAELILKDSLKPEDTIIKSIGYRQAIEFFAAPPSPAASPSAETCQRFLHFLQRFSTATRNYAQRQMKWYRKDSAFLFVQISRDHRLLLTSSSSSSASFLAAYLQVTEELLQHLKLSTQEYQYLLARQVSGSRHYQSLLQRGRLSLPYHCCDAEEYQAVLSLIRRDLLSLSVSSDEESGGRSSLVVDGALLRELFPRLDLTLALTLDPSVPHKRPRTESPTTGNSETATTALDYSIRFADNSHMRFFSSKFQKMTAQSLSSHPLYPSLIARFEELRRSLWTEKAEAMSRFREVLLED